MPRTLYVCQLLLLMLALPVHATEPPHWPFRLQILNYDATLNAVLLSGEFQNTLDKPLTAWRGELHLLDQGSEARIVLYIESQQRRPIPPYGWGVWSQWIDIKPDVAELQTLKNFTLEQLNAEVRLLRVLYTDGAQEGF